jgi:hypothetical protein
MPDDMFRRLRQGSSSDRRTNQEYSFQREGTAPSFRTRPGSTGSSTKRAGTTSSPSITSRYKRQEDGDRPPARPPVVREEGVIYEYEEFTFKDKLKDLGLRILEVGVGAAAYAIGEEVAHYFRKRRFFPKRRRRS